MKKILFTLILIFVVSSGFGVKEKIEKQNVVLLGTYYVEHWAEDIGENLGKIAPWTSDKKENHNSDAFIDQQKETDQTQLFEKKITEFESKVSKSFEMAKKLGISLKKEPSKIDNCIASETIKFVGRKKLENISKRSLHYMEFLMDNIRMFNKDRELKKTVTKENKELRQWVREQFLKKKLEEKESLIKSLLTKKKVLFFIIFAVASTPFAVAYKTSHIFKGYVDLGAEKSIATTLPVFKFVGFKMLEAGKSGLEFLKNIKWSQNINSVKGVFSKGFKKIPFEKINVTELGKLFGILTTATSAN